MMMNSEDSKKPLDKLRWGAFIIACCAFAFQVLVLYPWHLEISEEIKTLTKACMKR
jgi:hypothetical protein